MFFNLIPIPPLDGSSIVPLFLPDSAMRGWYQMQRYSFVILIGLLVLVPMVLKVDPIGTYFRYTVMPLMNVLLPA
jgi:Zn-dependent protease